jgi:hypothetical protein
MLGFFFPSQICSEKLKKLVQSEVAGKRSVRPAETLLSSLETAREVPWVSTSQGGVVGVAPTARSKLTCGEDRERVSDVLRWVGIIPGLPPQAR